MASSFLSRPTYVKSLTPQEVESEIKDYILGAEHREHHCCNNPWCIFSDAKVFWQNSDFLVKEVCSFHKRTIPEQLELLRGWCVDDEILQYEINNHAVYLCDKRLCLTFGISREEYIQSSRASATATAQLGPSPAGPIPEPVRSWSTTNAIVDIQNCTGNGLPEDGRKRSRTQPTEKAGEANYKNVDNETADSTFVEKADQRRPELQNQRDFRFPYDGKPRFDPEAKQPLFDSLKIYLCERSEHDDQRRLMQEYHKKIVLSKGTYKKLWHTGIIEEKKSTVAATLEHEYLLFLCLEPLTFLYADKPVLGAMYNDFDLKVVVRDAVVKWKMRESFPKIIAMTAKQPSTQGPLKGFIFVARVFFAMKLLRKGQDTLDMGLRGLVFEVLTAIESTLRVKDETKRRVSKENGGGIQEPSEKKARRVRSPQQTKETNNSGQRKKNAKNSLQGKELCRAETAHEAPTNQPESTEHVSAATSPLQTKVTDDNSGQRKKSTQNTPREHRNLGRPDELNVAIPDHQSANTDHVSEAAVATPRGSNNDTAINEPTVLNGVAMVMGGNDAADVTHDSDKYALIKASLQGEIDQHNKQTEYHKVQMEKHRQAAATLQKTLDVAETLHQDDLNKEKRHREHLERISENVQKVLKDAADNMLNNAFIGHSSGEKK